MMTSGSGGGGGEEGNRTPRAVRSLELKSTLTEDLPENFSRRLARNGYSDATRTYERDE